MRPADKQTALAEVRRRVVEACVRSADGGGRPLDEVIAESIYQEAKRLKSDKKETKYSKTDREFWDHVQSAFRRSNERTQQDLLGRVVGHYSEEVIGNFDDRVYQAVTRALPPTLGLLLNAASPKQLITNLPKLPPIEDAVELQGEVEHLRRLHEVGTVVLVPTHVSNLDSVIVGYAIYRLGLPPFVYGAGLNLFESSMLGFFMHNLGAYTVDRKKRDPLYKEVLKTYAAVSLEMGYDNIFFPGGTRARSGAIEQRLKLGLMGTALEAYVANLRHKKPNPKLFVVPVTLSFQLVLEAETLIDDFLKEVGKSRYVITDDEFSRPKLVFEFVSRLFNLNSKIHFTVGRGVDPFGNPVDDNGESLDPCGRHIDTTRYVLRGGEPLTLASRDAEYTREVGRYVGEAFQKYSVIHSTNVTARAVFGMLRKKNPHMDLLRLVRLGARYETMELRDLYEITDRLLGELRALSEKGKVRLEATVLNGSAEDVIGDGIRHFAVFHSRPAVKRTGDQIVAPDRNLLFYYQNRLEGYGVWPEPDLAPALSADHSTLEGQR